MNNNDKSLDKLIDNANSELAQDNKKQKNKFSIFSTLKVMALMLLFYIMLLQWQAVFKTSENNPSNSEYVDIIIKANESILSAKQTYGDLPDYLPDPTLSKIVDYQSTKHFYTLSLIGNNHLYYISSHNPSKIHREKIND